MRNQVNAVKPGAMKDVQILGKENAAADNSKKNGKSASADQERTQVRKREHKALMKSLQLA